MSRLKPQPWKKLVKVFEMVGFTVTDRHSGGSHIVMTRAGTLRPVVIPKYDEVGRDIIHANLRTAGLDREKYLKLLDQV